jgi:ABC-type antimicrobial peptide transport system permease subunit
MLVSERLWRAVWRESPEIVGTSIQLGTSQRTIIGVLPKEVDLPSGADVWIPMRTAFVADRTTVEVIARLGPGVPLKTAAMALEAVRAGLSRRPASIDGPDGPVLQPLQTFLSGNQESILRMLLTASILFLLLACAGIASLLLAQGIRRRREMILRIALGASRSRLFAQLLADTFLTVSVGGVVGLLLGLFEEQWLRSVLPGLNDTGHITPSSLLLVVGLCFGVTAVSGLVPALRAAREDGSLALKSKSEFVEVGLGHIRLSYRELFAGSQLMLALALLIGTALLIRTLVSRSWASSSVKATDVVTLHLELPRLPAILAEESKFFSEHGMDWFGRYGPRDHGPELEELARNLEPLKRQENERNRTFFEAVVNRLGSQPGILAVAAMDPVPFTEGAARPVIRRAYRSRPFDRATAEQYVSVRYAERRVTADAFKALRMSFVGGRAFNEEESHNAPDTTKPAVINDVLARSLWPGENPVGKRFFDSTYVHQEYRVLGVVVNDEFTGALPIVEGSVYIPFAGTDRVAGIVARLRTGEGAIDFQQAVNHILADIPPALPRAQIQRLDSLADNSLKDLRLMLALLAAFAMLGAVEAGLGVYGTMTLIAAAREREMAIRLALGASLWRVRGLALWKALRVLSVAFPGGILMGWILATSLAHAVPIRAGGNLLIYGGSCAVLVGIAVLAACVPVLRVTGMNMAAAIRQE